MTAPDVPVRPDVALLPTIPAVAELAMLPFWIVWEAERKPDGRLNKIPKRAVGRGNARVDRKATQTTFEAAIAAYDPEKHGGPGFVFHKELRLAGVDLDGCRDLDAGTIADWAWAEIRKANTYTEVSPSGTGVKMFGRGSVPEARKVGAIEVYDSGRFFTVTGHHVAGTPDTLGDISGYLADLWPRLEALKAKRGNGAAGEPILVDLGDDGAPPAKIEAKLKRLLANEDGAFARSWRHDRPDLRDRSLSSYDLSLCTIAAARGWSDPELVALIAAHRAARGDPSGKAHRKDYLVRTIAAARAGAARMVEETEAAASGRIIVSRGEPLATARAFVAARHLHAAGPLLHRHLGAFYRWNGSRYAEISDGEVRAGLYAFLDKALCPGSDGPTPFRPDRDAVNDVLDALKAERHLWDATEAPAWLDGSTGPPPRELVAFRNGLLHLATKRLIDPTPLFFGLNAVDFDYKPRAPEPDLWLDFLASLWPDDAEAIDCLQEVFGYCLTADTSQQKAFLLVGPKRSGKGTIARVLKGMLGAANVAGPTLSGLGSNFGLAPLIGRPLAIISDARLSGRADQHVIAERILSITGEDVLTVDRKHREAWTGTLPTRFLLLTNELPKIADASGALASRFIVLTLTESFYGREDHGLTARLLGELPGVLNWALAGWQRLRDRGHFQQPDSSAEAIADLEDLGSPIGAFLRDRCVVKPGASVPCEMLFNEWRLWCSEQGRDHPGTVQSFGRDLRAAVPGLRTSRPSDDKGGSRPRQYDGLGLLE